MQTENSSSGDAEAYGSVAAGSAELEAVRRIFRTSCIPCHSDFPTMTDAQFIAQGLAVAADPEGSKIYFRLSGSAGPGGPKDMPGGGGLPAADLDKFTAWILSL